MSEMPSPREFLSAMQGWFQQETSLDPSSHFLTGFDQSVPSSVTRNETFSSSMTFAFRFAALIVCKELIHVSFAVR